VEAGREGVASRVIGAGRCRALARSGVRETCGRAAVTYAPAVTYALWSSQRSALSLRFPLGTDARADTPHGNMGCTSSPQLGVPAPAELSACCDRVRANRRAERDLIRLESPGSHAIDDI